MTEHAEQVEQEGGVEVRTETADPVFQKSVRTRFGTQLSQLLYCHQYFTKLANYCSKLKVKPVKKEENKEEEDKKKKKQAKVKSVKAQIENSDELQNGFEYLSTFSVLPSLLTQLESQKMSLSQAASIVKDFQMCLEASREHPLEAKHRTAEKAISRMEKVIKERFTPIVEAAKANPLLERAPFSSIKVEGDFSVVKHLTGNRKNFKPDNLVPFLQVALHQRKRASSQNNTRERKKKVKTANQIARLDHSY